MTGVVVHVTVVVRRLRRRRRILVRKDRSVPKDTGMQKGTVHGMEKRT